MARISTMMGSFTIPKLFLLAFAAGQCASVSIPTYTESNFLGNGIDKRSIDPASLQSLGNNTLFEKWRPRYHFSGPAGWINDPCGAMYDPTRDEYHLMYQWNPNHVMWGNISWGHAVSKDLVTWTDIRDWKDASSQALAPNLHGTPYDTLGIFSGTAQPVNLKGEQDGTLTIFYTGVSVLPTNWRIPYTPGTEKQALATSKDGGKTWQRYEGNPVLPSPPKGWNITGWRDPFFEPYPELDTLLNQTEPHYYMVMGSGIKGVGPRIPLYSAPAKDLTKWTFLGALWEPKMNESFAGVEISGSQGFNFEVSGLYTLQEEEDGTSRHFANFGAEGGSVEGHGRWALWSEGKFTVRKNNSVAFETVAAGVSDWGNLYALTSFLDTKHNNRRVQWGWAEDEPNGFLPLARAIGYNGAMGLPRELFVKTIKGVVDTKDGYLSKKGSFVIEANDCKQKGKEQTFTASTQGLRPLPDVVRALRKSATGSYKFPCGARKSGIEMFKGKNGKLVQSDHFSLSATISRVGNAVSEVGFVVRASPDGEEQTKIVYYPQQHRIQVLRDQSSQLSQIVGNSTVWGHFRPLALPDREEDINFEIFVDGSLVEVFVNDRWAMTTRVYPWRDDSLGLGIYVKKDEKVKAKCEDDETVLVENVKLWTGLGEKVQGKNLGGGLVWPQRPADSSSKLVWDSPANSGNGVWWPGY